MLFDQSNRDLLLMLQKKNMVMTLVSHDMMKCWMPNWAYKQRIQFCAYFFFKKNNIPMYVSSRIIVYNQIL